MRRGRSRARGKGDEAARPPVITDLEERLAQIASEAVAPEDALEPALAAVVEASGAVAGALCLYDIRQCLLRLTAEVGLSDEGCQRLQTVRRADPACWDMPLHGLLNRRAYLIESAAKNRYVPNLVEKKTVVSTVICLPLYHHSAPLGSIVLVAGSPRTFTQRDIQLLWEPLKGLAKMIEQLRRQASTLVEPTPERDAPGMAVIEQTAMAVERDNLRALLAREKAAHAKLAAEMEKQTAAVEDLRDQLDDAVRRGGSRRLLAKLERTEAEREELRAALDEAERLRGEAESARDAAEAGGRAGGEPAADAARAQEDEQRRRETEQLRTRLAELEADGVRVHELQAELDRLAAEVEAAHEREAELQQALLDKAAAQDGTEEGLAATREEMRIVVTAREEAEAALSASREDLQAANDRLEVLAGEVEAARTELEHLRAQTGGAVEERTKLERELEDLRVGAAEAEARIGQLGEELTVVRGERDQATQALEAPQAEAEALRVTIATISTERDALREQVRQGEAAQGRVAELESALAAERAIRERGAGEIARLEAEWAAARSAQPTDGADSAVLARLRGDYETLTAERDAVAAERDDALARLADLDGVTAVPEMVSLAAEGIPALGESFADPAVEIEDESVTIISVPSEQVLPVEHPTEPVIAVIDASDTWKGIEIEGHHVSVISPEDDTAAIIAALNPVRVIANLSAGSINSLGALRKAGCEARFWACVADVDQNYGVPIGVVEPVIPPLEPESVIRKLGDYATRGARIVTVGADVDALMSLRQALARKRVSVSMAWDAKQAIDLIQQMTPDALVIDLDLPKRDGYRIITEAIVGLDPLPFTVLVGGRVKSGEAFVSALRERPTNDGQLPLPELLATLAWSSEVPPSIDQRRKPKPTPFGSHGGRR
jgi:CheY-like chemotaxis protein